jgi:hypothetical protein
MPPAKIATLPPFVFWMPKNCCVGCELSPRSLVERLRRPRLVDRDVHAADPGAVLSDVGDEVSTGVDDGDVHRLTDLGGLLLSGGDDATSILKIDGPVIVPFVGRWVRP